MSLDVYLRDDDGNELYHRNITHNLTHMADAAGFYRYMWRPEECGCRLACEIAGPIRAGLAELKARPEFYKLYSATNGWGTYEQFIPWLEDYVYALESNPKAIVEASR
jgi:hypothetical protein